MGSIQGIVNQGFTFISSFIDLGLGSVSKGFDLATGSLTGE